MRIALALFLMPLAAAAQDRYDLANAMSDRGWFDLAEDLFSEIRDSSGLPADERAEGIYGRPGHTPRMPRWPACP